MPDSSIYINGINGETGDYLIAPLSRNDLADRMSDDGSASLKGIAHSATKKLYGLRFDRSPERITEAGWGIVFHEQEEQTVRDALAPLISHRRAAMPDPRIARELVYKTGEDRGAFLARYGVAPPNVDPQKVPYYLLIVGKPAQIPFRFAHQLSVDYAVGRLDFDDAESYRRYAESVIAYEKAPNVATRKSAVFFGPEHDPSTRLSARFLLTPLAKGINGDPPIADAFNFSVRDYIGASARKDKLAEIIAEADDHRPSILFTASHGIGWPKGHPSQKRYQGALLCQDWKGGPVNDSQMFSAANIDADTHVHGLVAFHFACFSAGTPRQDRFPPHTDAPPPLIADEAFVAALPKALLAHPGGGALCCVGHVDRAWGYSIESPDAGMQLRAFENFVGQVMKGVPVGYAMKDFGEKYATLSVLISDLLEKRDYQEVDEDLLASMWVERNDAEAYFLIGDPAVRLRPEAMSAGGAPGGNHA